MLLLATALLGLADPVDLRRWKEVTLPGAPFRLDVPRSLDPLSERVENGIKYKSWQTTYGFMTLGVRFTDRDLEPASTPRKFLELFAGATIKDKKNATAKVTDGDVLGYPAAKLELDFDMGTGRYHLEEVIFRVGQDDWSIQVSRIVDGNLGAEAVAEGDHVFASIQAPAATPALVPLTAGRMKMNVPARAVVSDRPLTAEWATMLDKWTVYTIDDKKGGKMWLYHMRSKPGKPLSPKGLGDMLVQDVAEQSASKKKKFLFDEPIAGVTGYVAQGSETLANGEVAVRIIALGDGDDLWGLLASGLNMARTEAMFNEMTKSITIIR